jgi:SAM-dependent methyltransferase
VPDEIFDDPRLAAVYDALDSDRRDLDLYVSIARDLAARTVADIGCGTGTLACLFAAAGLDVIGVDPAEAMLEVARRKPSADHVRWIHGVATDLPPLTVDLATMTGNVAQVFLDDQEWTETLTAAHRVLRPGGVLAFETRRPEQEAWHAWNPTDSFQRVAVPGVGIVESWNTVVNVALPYVTFRGTIVFQGEGVTLESSSTLRFRSYDEIVTALDASGFGLHEVRDAPDRPNKEWVFVARRL